MRIPWWVAVGAALAAVGGCADPWRMAPHQILRDADAGGIVDPAAVNAYLVVAFDRAGLGETLARLADRDERVAVAAARSAGRWPVRKDGRLAQQAADALAAALGAETRPHVASAQLVSLANLVCNRQGLSNFEVRAEQTIRAVGDLAATRSESPAEPAAQAGAFLAEWNRRRPARLGPNVFDGPGYRSGAAKRDEKHFHTPPWPATASAPRPAEPHPQRIHTVPVIAWGEVRLGRLDDPGSQGYLVIDHAAGTAAPVRMTAYGHHDLMLWSISLIGDDRPLLIAPGDLPDLDGGLARIVYVDLAGRVVVRDAAGGVVRAGAAQRDLDWQVYFDPTAPSAASLRVANLRGGGRRDLLLVRGPNVLALTGDFKLLWHLRLDCLAGAGDLLIDDLDGDGRDEIVWRNIGIDDNGRVLWTWIRPTEEAVGGLAIPGRAGRLVALGSPQTIGGFDAAGPLWEVPGPDEPGGRMLVGRFLGPGAGTLVGFAARPGGEGLPLLLNAVGGNAYGFGATAGAALPTPDPRSPTADPRRSVRLDWPALVCDWDRDGIDEVWATDAADKHPLPGWFKWPHGPAVRKILLDPDNTRLIGLATGDGDGRARLLYFQGKSLAVQRN